VKFGNYCTPGSACFIFYNLESIRILRNTWNK
jgi:hypothetical protein